MNEKRKTYRAVIVALDEEEGILFAKRSDSVQETDHIIMDDIMRIMDDYDTDVTLKNERDGYGEWVMTLKTPDNQNNLMYKVCFDDDEKEEEHDSEKND